MWKDEYVSGMKKLSPGEEWRAETLRRMERAQNERRVVPTKRAAAWAACAAALLLAVATVWPGVTQRSVSGGVQSIEAAAAAPEQMEKVYSTQGTMAQDQMLANAPWTCGTVVRWTEDELVLSVEGAQQVFRLDEQTELEEGALEEGAPVRVASEQREDGLYACQVLKDPQ